MRIKTGLWVIFLCLAAAPFTFARGGGKDEKKIRDPNNNNAEEEYLLEDSQNTDSEPEDLSDNPYSIENLSKQEAEMLLQALHGEQIPSELSGMVEAPGTPPTRERSHTVFTPTPELFYAMEAMRQESEQELKEMTEKPKCQDEYYPSAKEASLTLKEQMRLNLKEVKKSTQFHRELLRLGVLKDQFDEVSKELSLIRNQFNLAMTGHESFSPNGNLYSIPIYGSAMKRLEQRKQQKLKLLEDLFPLPKTGIEPRKPAEDAIPSEKAEYQDKLVKYNAQQEAYGHAKRILEAKQEEIKIKYKKKAKKLIWLHPNSVKVFRLNKKQSKLKEGLVYVHYKLRLLAQQMRKQMEIEYPELAKISVGHEISPTDPLIPLLKLYQNVVKLEQVHIGEFSEMEAAQIFEKLKCIHPDLL